MFFLGQNYLTRGFWGDEAWTSLISQLPYLDMLKTTAADFHPPGYYTIVGLVYQFLPPTEIVTRSISIFFYLATVFLAFVLASSVRGKVFGLLSALVIAVNPIFFRYAFEARNYTMFAFFATGSVYFLLKLLEKFNLKRAIFFVIFTSVGMYTHYYMFFILAAQGFYLILFSGRTFGFDLKTVLKVGGLYTVCGLLFLGWVPFLLGQLMSVSSSYWISPVDWRHTHFEAFLRIMGGEEKNVFRSWLFALSSALLILGLLQHLLKRSFEKPYILICFWAVFPFVLATLPGLRFDGFSLPFRPIFFWRYLIPAAVPLSLILVHGAQKLPKIFFAGSIAGVIFLSVAINFLTFRTYPYNFKQVFEQTVVPNISQNDKIVTTLPSFAEVLYYKNRSGLKNELIVLNKGLVQFSGKSLLDAYAQKGEVVIGQAPEGKYFELKQGPKVELRVENIQ